MDHQLHSNEVEESISKQELEDKFVTSENLKEIHGKTEADERKCELEVENKCGDLKAALKESSQQIDKSNENLIITGASASDCVNDTETTASEQTGKANVLDKAAKGMIDVNEEIEDERTAEHLSLSDEAVEEIISKLKLGNAFVSVKYDSEVPPSPNEPFMSETLKEPSGEKEMELQNQCGSFNGEMEGSPKYLNGELEIESWQDSESNTNFLTLDLSPLNNPKEALLTKVVEAVAVKGRKYRETISNLLAESEILKQENSFLAKEFKVAKGEEFSLDTIMVDLKETLSSLNSRMAEQNELKREHEEVALTLKSLHESLSQTNEFLTRLKNENTSLQQQVTASEMEFFDHWDSFISEMSKDIEEIENQKRRIEEEKVQLESLEGQKEQSQGKFEEAQKVSQKKDQEMKFVEKKYGAVRSLYNGDVRDLTNGCAVMKAHIEHAKGNFDKEMDYLEEKLQAVETKKSVLAQQFQMVKILKEKN